MYTLNVYEYGVPSPLRRRKPYLYILYMYILNVYVVRCAFRATRNEVRLGSYIHIYYTYKLNVYVLCAGL